ncbi:MAG: protein kinase, partial [Bacteroidota bacterium]
GMGIIYKAVDLRLDRTVALKFLSPFLTSDSESRERFIREAKAASALQHNNICTVHDIDQALDSRVFIVMDCYQGETLKHRMERSALSVDETARVAVQMARGLATAHEHGIIHRDIKPENLFLTDDGIVKILDFGLAKLAGQSFTQSSGAPQGTVAYMSPEQIMGDEVTTATDIWSFGMVLFEMLTQSLPFQGQHAPAMMYAILNEDVPLASSLRADVPQHLVKLCAQCLSKVPSGRPSSMGEILLRLEGRPPGTYARRIPRSVLVLLAAILVVSVLYVILRGPLSRLPPQATPATLAVFQFKDLTRDTAAAAWPEVVQTIMVTCLTGVEGLRVYDPAGLNSLGQMQFASGLSSPGAEESAHLPRVQFTFEGSILRVAGRYLIHLNVCNGLNHEVFASLPCNITSEAEIPRAVDSLSLSGLEVIQAHAEFPERSEHLQSWWPNRFRSIHAMKAFSLACRLALKGGQSGSESALRLAIGLDSTFITPRVWLVTRLVWEGKTREAEMHLRSLMARRDSVGPFDRAIIDWAKACVERNDSAQIACLNGALEYSPGNAILLYSLGRTKYLKGDFRGCVEVLKPVADRRWEYPLLYLLLGQAYDMIEDYDAEKAALQFALSLEHPPPQAHYLMATLFRRSNNPAGATAEDDIYIETMKQRGMSLRSIYTTLSDINITEGFMAESMIYYRHAIGGAHEQASDHLAKADTLCTRGDTLRAVVEYVRALAIDSMNAPATLRLAQSLEWTKNPTKALFYYQKYLTLDTTSPEAANARLRVASLRQ